MEGGSGGGEKRGGGVLVYYKAGVSPSDSGMIRSVIGDDGGEPAWEAVPRDSLCAATATPRTLG